MPVVGFKKPKRTLVSWSMPEPITPAKPNTSPSWREKLIFLNELFKDKFFTSRTTFSNWLANLPSGSYVLNPVSASVLSFVK